jgi:3-oxoadipate enol-lactonase
MGAAMTDPSGSQPSRPDLWAQVSGEGPLVVLMHGLADTHDLWRHVAPSLAARYTTAAIDHYGHGQSPLPDGRLTTARMADGVAALIERLGGGPAVLVGLSMGGGIAQALTLARPELVRALALVSTSSYFSPEARARHHQRADLAERDGMAAIVDELVPRWFTPAFAAAHPEEVELSRQTVLANPPERFAAAARANADRDFSERLGEIRCPVIYIGGLDDPAGARDRAEVYRQHLPGIRIHLLADASHLIPVEHPTTLNGLLLGFLDEVHGRT